MISRLRRLLEKLDSDTRNELLELIRKPEIYVTATNLISIGNSKYVLIKGCVAKDLGNNTFHIIIVPSYTDLPKILDLNKLRIEKY